MPSSAASCAVSTPWSSPTCPTPEPGACGVRIRVRAAGVNFADSLMLAGRYQEKPPLPFTPGLELAGEIDAVGAGVRGLEPGQRVLAVVGHGAFAEQAVARAEDVVLLPDDMDEVTAAGFAIAYGTAHGALRWRAELHAGETLVVHGAGSGVGLTAVECGKAIGATVIATARGDEKLEVARAHGADHVLDSDGPELQGRGSGRSPTGAAPTWSTIRSAGPMFDASLRAVAWEGRIVIVGFASGKVPQIPANLLLVKNAACSASTGAATASTIPSGCAPASVSCSPGTAEGRIRPLVSRTLPLARTAEAIRLLSERRAIGKVVRDHGRATDASRCRLRLAPSHVAASLSTRR